MLNVRFLFIFISITLVLLLVYSFIQSKNGEITALNLKLRQALVLIKKHEKRYKTSHSNELRYADSNRDLQKNLARQGEQLSQVSMQLDVEKTKLSNAFLFYAQIKDLFEVAGEKDSHEQVVETKVLDKVIEKAKQWKSSAEKLRKSNFNESSAKQDTIKNELNSLHVAHRNLQEDYEKTSAEYFSLKQLYSRFQKNRNNISGVYESQIKKLRKQLEKCRLKSKNKRNNGLSGDAPVRKPMTDPIIIRNTNSEHKQAIKSTTLNDLVRVTRKKLKVIPTLSTISKVIGQKQGTETSKLDIVKSSSKETWHQKSSLKTVVHTTTRPNEISTQDTGHKLSAKEIYIDFDGEPKHEPDGVVDRIDEHGLSIDMNPKNETTETKDNSEGKTTTIIPKTSTQPPPTKKPRQTQEIVKKPFKSQKDIYQDFDGEPKHEPEHLDVDEKWTVLKKGG